MMFYTVDKFNQTKSKNQLSMIKNLKKTQVSFKIYDNFRLFFFQVFITTSIHYFNICYFITN